MNRSSVLRREINVSKSSCRRARDIFLVSSSVYMMATEFWEVSEMEEDIYYDKTNYILSKHIKRKGWFSI